MLRKMFRLVARKIFSGSKESPTKAKSEVKNEKVERDFVKSVCDTCLHESTCPIVLEEMRSIQLENELSYLVESDSWPHSTLFYDHSSRVTGTCHYEPHI